MPLLADLVAVLSEKLKSLANCDRQGSTAENLPDEKEARLATKKVQSVEEGLKQTGTDEQL